MVCRKLAEALSADGLDVEVLTTCVKDFYADWGDNFYREGTYHENGVTVRRFGVRRRNKRLFDSINLKLMNRLPVSAAEEQQFVEEIVRSDALCAFIADNRRSYSFVFIPYMFGTTCWALPLCPERSLLIPCLHDEPYAYMRPYRAVFESAAGLVFLSRPEMELALRLYDLDPKRCHLVGGGVDTEVTGDATSFRAKYKLPEPFLLYVGRREPGKNTPLLLEYFSRFKRRYPGELKLVLAGSGMAGLSPDSAADIVDLGFLSEDDKCGAYAAASLVCQPSVHESFSLSIMEAWVQGTPVLVHAGCGVTSDHCTTSNGGLCFRDYDEFEECVSLLLGDGNLARQMGANGRRYVLNSFSWPRITQRYVDILRGLS
ncbi:MAG: glycosyltransferase family 4 protein [Chloroflexi bacterium]|nr:glycosyltransferase family 4 protein [Chloroflexota bacterium]